MAVEVKEMIAFKSRGALTVKNRNNLRVQAAEAGVRDAFSIDGFAERYIRPLFCRGIGPFRWVTLSGDESDLARLDDLAGELFSSRPEVKRWIDKARTGVKTQGLP